MEKVYILYEGEQGSEQVVNVFESETLCNKYRDYYTGQYPSRSFRTVSYDVVSESSVNHHIWELTGQPQQNK